MPSLHRHTPVLTALDPRGAPVRTVAYHRLRAEDEPVARITRSVYGATGFLQQQWDPRLQALQATDAEVKPTVSHCYSLTGQVLRTDSVDAGWRVMLLGGAGQPVRSWDANGARQRHDYDRLLRPVAVFEQAQDDPVERCVERLTYAAATPGQAANNCSGRLVRHEDPAGSVRIEHYSLTGAVTGQSRRFAEPGARIDWPARKSDREALLQAENFTSTGRYNALGAVLEQVDAKGHRRFFDYGVSGELTGTQLQFSGGQRKVLMHRRRYNAHGQVIAETAGNGLLTQARYDEADGRLQQWVVYASANKARVLQDLTYAYDRVGNVTRVEDAAQPTVWASNSQIEAVSHYAYDTLYQLIKATGREQAQHTGGSALPGLVLFGSAQATLWRNYSRHYQYDAAGNLLQMQHVPSTGQGYTQRMRVAARSNHSQPEALGITPGPGSGFDRCGNQQALARGQMMSWNARNQLVHVTQVMREDGDPDEESYGYDAAGQRVLKWRSSKAKGLSHRREVRYLPGLELHRDEATGQWLNVLSVEAGHTTVRALQWERGLPAQAANEQLRYGLSDLTGSCTLELDAQAALLSQEGYYPYGATAWWAARSALEASYKTVRYSGKERDATGLYYYGFRYYAPWLHRWISPDPAGGAEGLNLFTFVKSNVVSRRDPDGRQSDLAREFSAAKGDLYFGRSEAIASQLSFYSRLTQRGYYLGPFLQPDKAVVIKMRNVLELHRQVAAEFIDKYEELADVAADDEGLRRVDKSFDEYQQYINKRLLPFSEAYHANIGELYKGYYKKWVSRPQDVEFAHEYSQAYEQSRYAFTKTFLKYATTENSLQQAANKIVQKNVTGGSKAALDLIITGQGARTARFILDGLDLQKVIEPDRSAALVTVAELRHLYRHKASLGHKVAFYLSGKRVAAPWETNPTLWSRVRRKDGTSFHTKKNN